MPGGSGGVVALLDTLTFPETLTILVIALVVLGPEKLPGMARTIGQWLTKAKRMAANLQDEMRDVVDDPVMKPLREIGEFAAQPKRKLAEYALAAEAEVSQEQAEAILQGADEAAAPTGEHVDDEQVVEEVVAEIVEPDAVEPDVVEPDVVEAEVVAPESSETPPTEKVVVTGPDHPMERQSPLPADPEA